MPYTNATMAVSERMQEARLLLAACGSAGLADGAKRAIRGHLYVTLHAMYERCVSDCVFNALGLANGSAIPLRDLKPGFLVFAVHPQLQGYRSCKSGKSWAKGIQVMHSVVDSGPAQLHSVFPADGSFMKPSQLALIWELFQLPGDPWPHPRLTTRIVEIVDARNQVAHGGETAGARGGTLSDAEMRIRVDDFELLCCHIVGTFSANLATAADFVK